MPAKKIEQVLKEKKIYEIVNPKLVQAPPETSVTDAVQLMQTSRAGYVVVAQNQQVLGVFTERDVATKVLEQNIDWSSPIGKLIDPDPPILRMTDSVGSAIKLMGKSNLYYIPLTDEKKHLVNVISVRTLIRFLAAFYPNEVYNLPPRADQIHSTPEGG